MKSHHLLITITFLIMLVLLPGCKGNTSPTQSSNGHTNDNLPTNTDKIDGEEANNSIHAGENESATNYSWFEMPEETGNLVLYTGDTETNTMQEAIAIFESLYPEVQIEWQKLTPEEYESKIRTEIPAGRGPDLLYTDDSVLPDVYKTMMTGLFEDLNPYLSADNEIDSDDFIRGVFDAGIVQNNRYLIPITHGPTILTTSKEILGEIGVSQENLSTYDGFLDACSQFHSLYPESCIFPDLGPDDTTSTSFSVLYASSGFHLIDYENSTVTLAEEPFRKMIDLCRLYAGNNPNQLTFTDGSYILSGALLKRECLFSDIATVPLMMQMIQTQLIAEGETAVFLTPPDSEDGKATEVETYGAIRANSPNKLNAWRMLKVLLSNEIQGNPKTINTMKPVRLSAIPLFLSDYDVLNTIPGLEDLLNNFDHGHIRPPVLYRYVWDAMNPYINGNKSFDDCYKKLLNTLELYKDE